MIGRIHRLTRVQRPIVPSSLPPLACAVDHVVWSVANLDEAIEQLVERMGFPLLYGPAGSASMRMVDVGFGVVWIRLVEKAEWRKSQPLSLALLSSLPLDEAGSSARQRGFDSGGVFISAGREAHGLLPRNASAPLPFVAFVLLRGAVTPHEPGLLLVRYFHEVQARRVSECMRFLDSPASAYGVQGFASVRVEISDETGYERWARVLGHKAKSSHNRWELPEGGTIEAILGGDDRISSIALQASDLSSLRREWHDAGVDCEFCGARLFVRPSSAGGLHIQVRESEVS